MRSKRFRSSYRAKVEARKKKWEGEGEEKRENAHDSVSKTPLYTFHVSFKN